MHREADAAGADVTRGRGHFDWQVLLGLHDPTGQAIASRAPLFGMQPQETFWWGTLRDGDGEIVYLIRPVIASGPGSPRRLLVQTSTAEGDHLRIHPVGREAARAAPVQIDVVDGWGRFRSAADNEGRAFNIATDGGTFTWDEAETASLSGRSVGPGLHWYLPELDGAIFYAAQVFEAEGRVLGGDVRGFVAIDQIYLPDGRVFYRDDPVAANDLLVAFFVFGTRWDDGTVEAGHVAVGHDRFGYAVVNREHGNVVCTTAVEAEVATDADGYFSRAGRLHHRRRGVGVDARPKGAVPRLRAHPQPPIRWLPAPRWRAPHAGDLVRPGRDGAGPRQPPPAPATGRRL